MSKENLMFFLHEDDYGMDCDYWCQEDAVFRWLDASGLPSSSHSPSSITMDIRTRGRENGQQFLLNPQIDHRRWRRNNNRWWRNIYHIDHHHQCSSHTRIEMFTFIPQSKTVSQNYSNIRMWMLWGWKRREEYCSEWVCWCLESGWCAKWQCPGSWAPGQCQRTTGRWLTRSSSCHVIFRLCGD